MDDNLTKLLEEAILLELHVSKLYLLFSKLFPEDADFWWQICLEEKNHAALLKSGKTLFCHRNFFPMNYSILIYKN